MSGYLTNASRFVIAVAALLIGRCLFAAPSFTAGVETGSIQNAAVNEASGIAASRLNPNVLWTHNDSGSAAQIFPMTPAGTNLGTYAVSGATNFDWEDIAVGPGPVAGTQYLYIGDIGDNFAFRSNISVYRVPEPVVSDTQSPAAFSLSGAVKLTFAYPDGPRDAESLFVDPQSGDIYFISKQENPHHVYKAAYPQPTSATTMLELVNTFDDPNRLTAADISVNGNEIIARATGITTGRMWIRPPGGSIADAFDYAPITIPLRVDNQGEAIGFDPNGWGYYTTSEGANRPIHYFDRLLTGDFNNDGSVDAADYVTWRKNGGTPAEYEAWRANFGNTAGGGGNRSRVTVPEPATLAMTLGCLIAFAGRAYRQAYGVCVLPGFWFPLVSFGSRPSTIR